MTFLKQGTFPDEGLGDPLGLASAECTVCTVVLCGVLCVLLGYGQWLCTVQIELRSTEIYRHLL